MKLCEKCGFIQDEKNEFCENCSNLFVKITPEDVKKLESKTDFVTPKKDSKKAFVLSIISIALIVFSWDYFLISYFSNVQRGQGFVVETSLSNIISRLCSIQYIIIIIYVIIYWMEDYR